MINLKWSSHIHYIPLQLSHYSGTFYKIRNLIPFEVSKMLYYCFIHSRNRYGIVIWGNAAKSFLKQLSVRLNNIIRTITLSKKYNHMTNLYKNLNLLNLNDIYKPELAKFMYQLHHGTLPKSFVAERAHNTFNLIFLRLLPRNSGVFTATKNLLVFFEIKHNQSVKT